MMGRTARIADLWRAVAGRHPEVARRLIAVQTTLDRGTPADDPAAATEATLALLERGEVAEIWLLLAVLRAVLPDSATVRRVVRSVRTDGADRTLAQLLRDNPGTDGRTVEIVTGEVLVDVTNTARVTFATGIQRVARETSRRWVRHDPTYVGWHPDLPALQRLSPSQQARALAGSLPTAEDDSGRSAVIVPWQCRYLLVELQVEPRLMSELQAVAEFSPNSTACIGFDCVPLTSAETTAAESVSNGFARHLAAAAHMDRIATISHAAEVEYTGWRAMLAGTGLRGPAVSTVLLPSDRTRRESRIAAGDVGQLRAGRTPDGARRG